MGLMGWGKGKDGLQKRNIPAHEPKCIMVVYVSSDVRGVKLYLMPPTDRWPYELLAAELDRELLI